MRPRGIPAVDYLYYTVKLLHVALAVFWIGGVFTGLVVLQPLLQQSTPHTRREFSGRLGPIMLRTHNILGGLTLLTGIALVTVHPHGWTGVLDDRWGRTVVFALIATVSALYLVNTSLRSTLRAIAKVTAEVGPEEEPPANLRFLLMRFKLTGRLIFGILLLVLVLMLYANVTFFGPS